MAKAKSQTFLRTILLVLFVVFMVSPEIAAKQDNSISGGKSKKGVSSEKWLPPLKHSKASTRGLEETVILLGKKMTDSGFIYAIKAKKQPYVKIGLSADPFQRIRNLQPGSPYKLQVAQTWEVHNMKASEDLAHEAMEEYILRRHEDNPYETEWFEMPEGGLEKVDEIVSGAISEHISGKTTKYDVE